MTMFKKGELVRMINDDYAMETPSHIVEYKKGELYTVYDYKPSNYPLLRVVDSRMSGGFGVVYSNNVEKVEKRENTMPKFKIGDVIKNIDGWWQDKRIVDITDDDYIVEVRGIDDVADGRCDFTIDFIDKHYQLKDEQSEEKQPTYTYSIYRTDSDEFEDFECIVSENMNDNWIELTDIDGDTYRIRTDIVNSIYKVKDSE